MDIECLYKEYIQKSRIFLYPILNIRKGGSVTPIQTFVSWEGQYGIEDCKLIALYHHRQDPEFRKFEKEKLLGHSLFQDFKMVEEEKGVYVFDLKEYEEDFKYFIEGRYSMFSSKLKSKIQNFFPASQRGFVDGYLYPDRYFSLFAKVFIVDNADHAQMKAQLEEVGQLCSKPDLSKENLLLKEKTLFFLNKSS